MCIQCGHAIASGDLRGDIDTAPTISDPELSLSLSENFLSLAPELFRKRPLQVHALPDFAWKDPISAVRALNDEYPGSKASKFGEKWQHLCYLYQISSLAASQRKEMLKWDSPTLYVCRPCASIDDPWG